MVHPEIRGILLDMKLRLSFFLLLLCQICLANEPYRIIAILENERALTVEPDGKLVSFFHSPDAAIRVRAILAAARIGNKAVIPDLNLPSSDKNVEVRKMVAFCLGQIRSKDGLKLALKMLKDPDLEVRRLAIEATGRIGGFEATPELLPFLTDGDSSLREHAALALALIKDKASLDPLLTLAGKDDPMQWAAVYALYRLADDRAVPVLHQVIAKPAASPSTGDPSSLLFALKALWSMKKPLTSDEVNALLKNSDPRVQANALDVIAASSPGKGLCDPIEKSYASMTVSAKWKAIDTMGALGCDALLPGLLKEKDPNLRGAALQALAKIKKDDAFPQLKDAYADEAWIVRWRVAEALADFSAESAVPLLTTLTQDTDSAVRLAALDSLTHFLPQTAEMFVPLLKSDDFTLRATAADALGQTKDPKYLPMLLETYNASSDPSQIEGRMAVLDVLADFNTSAVFDVFTKALQDPEYTIRRHAIDGIKKLVGSQFYWNGKVQDPEDFLYSKNPASRAVAAKYPASFGEPVSDVQVEMKLEKGSVMIRLLGSQAPIHVENFKKLTEKGFYNGLRIHRVVPNFVIQGGDPRGDGWGSAGEVVHDQMNLLTYKRGMVGMPIAGKDTGGSQFFITMSRQPHLDGNYTIFGEVVSGMDVVDQTEIGDKILSVTVR